MTAGSFPKSALLGHEQGCDDIDPQGQAEHEHQQHRGYPDHSGVQAQIPGDAAAHTAEHGVGACGAIESSHHKNIMPSFLKSETWLFPP